MAGSDLQRRRAALTVTKTALLERRLGGGSTAKPIRIDDPIQSSIPLSFAQERLWFLAQLDRGNAAYNTHKTIRLSGVLDPRRVAEAFAALTQRHDILRTAFPVEDGTPRQHLTAAPRLRNVDLSALTPSFAPTVLRRILTAAAGRSFELERYPPWEAVLIRTGPDEHLLSLAMHHLVSDGWSTSILLSEFATFLEGRSLPESRPLQYADFTLWQHRYLSGPRRRQLETHWIERLRDMPPVVDLPQARARPATRTFRGGRVPLTISTDLVEPLRRLAAEEHATLFMAGLAAFKLFLITHGAPTDLVVGITVAGRDRIETQATLGPFINVLPIRTDLYGVPSFREAIRRVRGRTVEALDHQELPFELLVAAVKPDRSLGHEPLVQMMFSLQRAEAQLPAPDGLALEAVPTELRTAAYDLQVDLVERAGSLSGSLEYNTDLFAPATARRMARQFRAVLGRLVRAPDDPFGAPDPGQRRLLDRWDRRINQTAMALPPGTIWDRIAEAARLTPDRIALRDQDGGLGYAALCRRAAGLAAALFEAGVRRGDRVGLVTGRGVDLVVAMLAILRTGAVFVPLDPAQPETRQRGIVGDAGLKLLVSSGNVPPALAALPRIDATTMSDGPLPPPPEPGDLAYVMFTSGSTGRPKAVMVTNRAVANVLRSVTALIGFGSGQSWLAITAATFDISILELLGPLAFGGTVVVAPPGSAVEGDRLKRLIVRHRPDVLQSTPAGWSLLHLAGWRPDATTTLLCGGEALPADLADALCANGAQAFNLYGPTEATIWASAHPLRPGTSGGSLGRPLYNVALHLLGPGGAPTAPGALGEIFIGGGLGPGDDAEIPLSYGYLGQPRLTAERFLPDPFATQPGARMYRTGDLARRESDGRLWFHGRRDDQIKLRGHLVALGEIEHALRTHPAVVDAAVVQEGAGAAASLVAHVTGTATEAELRSWMSGRLPTVMVPARVVSHDRLPMTPSGKIDRRRLTEIAAHATPSHAPVRRQDEVDALVAMVWGKLMQRDPATIPADADFFGLGGHSLMAAQMTRRIGEMLGRPVAVRELFVAPTLDAFAARLRSALAAERPAPTLTKVAGGEVPASAAQKRLLFLNRLDPGGSEYLLTARLDLGGPLKPTAVATAWHKVLLRHGTLRTVFESRGGSFVQHARPPSPEAFRIVDRAADPAAPPPRPRAIDPETGPAARLTLYRRGPADHLLELSVHHIAADGPSLQTILSDLARLYAAELRVDPPPLPMPAVSYADYAATEAAWRDGAGWQHLRDYWRQQLDPGVEGGLPTDFPRPSTPLHSGARHRFTLPTALSAELLAMARRMNVTPFMLTLAVYQILLMRFADSRSVTVGTPVANRLDARLAEAVGPFANILPLGLKLVDDPPLSEILAEVRRSVLGALAHQDLPFDEIVRDARLSPDISRHPLFQTVFEWRAQSDDTLDFPGLTVRALTGSDARSQFDLSLSLGLDAAGVSIEAIITYDADLFTPATVESVTLTYQSLLAHVAAGPDVRLLSADLPGHANTVPESPLPRRLDALVEAVAAAYPDRIAVAAAEGSLTYASLTRCASALAAMLGPQARGRRIAMAMPRTPAQIVAILGILKAGAAYLPLDPESPPARLAAILAEAEIGTVVTDPDTAVPLPPDVRRLCLNGAALASAGGSPPAPCQETTGPAYVIYTSGSTGPPKGVVIPHAAAASYVQSAARSLALTAEDRLLHFAPASFDTSVEEIFATLSVGACLVLRDETMMDAPRRFMTSCAAHAVTVLDLPTAFWHVLVADLTQGRARLPPSIRVVYVGGEAISARRLAQWMDSVSGGVALHNGYGPTETTVVAAQCRLNRDDASRATVPIGWPVAGAALHLVDSRLIPTPAGGIGQIAIGGANLAQGYLKNPRATAERFLPDPFATAPGARMFRTGDYGRRLPDGRLTYHGRRDRQVKLRGFRVEPAEVEAALATFPEIAAVAAVPRPGEDGEVGLHAFVVPAADSAVVPDALRTVLSTVLPNYLVPDVIHVVQTIPLTGSGKIDTARLHSAPPEPSRSATLPMDLVPLAAIWTDLLPQRPTRPNDNFFALGGHSLLAMRLASRIAEVWGVEIGLRRLFAAPRLAEMAAAIAAAPAAAPFRPVPRHARMPMSPIQQRLWFLEELAPGRRDYLLASAVRLTGRLQPDLLLKALVDVTKRHEILRLGIVAEDGVPFFSPEIDAGPIQRLIDLTALPMAARESVAARLRQLEARRPFSNAGRPLIRAVLLRLDTQTHQLVTVLHHLIGDGRSMEIIAADWAAAYEARRAGRPLRLARAAQFLDVAYYQAEAQTSPAYHEGLAYFQRALAGASAIPLPVDRPPGATPSGRGDCVALALPPPLAKALFGAARAAETTPFVTLLAALYALLRRVTGEHDLTLLTPISQRVAPALDTVVGPLIDTVALRIDAPEPLTFADCIRRAHDTVTKALSHGTVPFEKVIESLATPGRTAPAFNVLVAWTVATRPGKPTLDGVGIEPIPLAEAAAQTELAIHAAEADGRIRLDFVFDPASFDRSTILALRRRLLRLLRVLLVDLAQSILIPDLAGRAERRRLLSYGKGARSKFDGSSWIHELIARQASRTPDAIAVTAGTEAITYAQLDVEAERLARHLVAAGVGPELRVGLALERGIDLVISLLAVLKAGGAFVPLDPSYPADRSRFIADDAALHVVLCDEAQRPLWPRSMSPRPGTEPSIAPPTSMLTAESLAYVLYTSGSTGRPKGAMNTHGAILNRILWMQDAYRLGPVDAVLQKTPIGFDVAVWEFLWPLATGARLTMLAPDAHRDSVAVAQAILQGAITTLHFVPSVLALFLEEAGPRSYPQLSRVIVSGEALTADLARRARAAFGAEVFNLYGPTEAAIDVTAQRFTEDGTLTVPIGLPIANVDCRVLDVTLRPCPAGVVGELYIGGAAVGRGYVGRPGLTAERYIPDPYAEIPGARLYRTGDLCRVDSAGMICFLGRRDTQVKIRGQRIELGEVEAALTALPELREAAVLVVHNDRNEPMLVAYAAGSSEADVASLRRALAQRLPPAMIPARIVLMPRLPRLPNGKLDRNALPAVPTAEAGDRPPLTTATQRLVAAIWSEVLSVETLHADSDFFALGGHSLLATRVMARLAAKLGRVPLRTLFDHPRLGDFAVAAESQARPPAPLPKRTHQRVVQPLSGSQREIHDIDRCFPGNAFHLIPVMLRLDGELNIGDMVAALRGVVDRHPALRIRVVRDGAALQQRVGPIGRYQAEVIDLSNLPPSARADMFAQRLMAEATRAIDPVRTDPIRATLIRLKSTLSVLILGVTHMIADGWSMAVILRDLGHLYSTMRTGGEPDLPPLPADFFDFLACETEADGQRETYWRNLFAAPLAPLALPFDRPAPTGFDLASAHIRIDVAPHVAAALPTRVGGLPVTTFSILAAAVAETLGSGNLSSDICIGTINARRSDPRFDNVVGLFADVLPVRWCHDAAAPLLSRLSSAHLAVLAAQEHGDISFDRIRELAANQSARPLFNVMCILQNLHDVHAAFDGLTVEQVTEAGAMFDTGVQFTTSDLIFVLASTGGRLAGRLIYKPSRFDGATARRIVARLLKALRRLGREVATNP